jgi:hypothetical protein
LFVVALIASAVFAEEEAAGKKEKRGLGYGLGYGYSGLGIASPAVVSSPLYSGYSSVSVHPSYGYNSYSYGGKKSFF